jgi:bifunctional DNA-binding transcriptional regulator/antitoxin component of YhaV-PrlF toxin-antitoxin module
MSTVDDKRRVTLPKTFRKGDAVSIIPQSSDVVLIVRMRTAPTPATPRPKLVRRKDGFTVLEGGQIDSATVKRMLEEFP